MLYSRTDWFEYIKLHSIEEKKHNNIHENNRLEENITSSIEETHLASDVYYSQPNEEATNETIQIDCCAAVKNLPCDYSILICGCCDVMLWHSETYICIAELKVLKLLLIRFWFVFEY